MAVITIILFIILAFGLNDFYKTERFEEEDDSRTQKEKDFSWMMNCIIASFISITLHYFLYIDFIPYIMATICGYTFIISCQYIYDHLILKKEELS